jgi:hypothetical protein
LDRIAWHIIWSADEGIQAANFGYFTAIVYGHFIDARHYRVACDLVNLLFVFDDLSDELPAQDARTVAAISLDALWCGHA